VWQIKWAIEKRFWSDFRPPIGTVANECNSARQFLNFLAAHPLAREA
jgi:hypothetical protein